MGEIGRHRVATELAWEYSVPQLLQAYEQGLGLRPGRTRVDRPLITPGLSLRSPFPLPPPTTAKSMPKTVSPHRPDSLRLLVVIASYGEKNLGLLHEVIRRYREMPYQIDIVVISNAPKNLGPDVEVVVGLPTSHPWSLPFAHKAVFAQRARDYDLFLYSEDDMGVTEAHIGAFLRATPQLAEDEIAGFMRYEVDNTGTTYLLDVHGRFHWRPVSGSRRGDYMIAEFTNEHAALYLLTQKQLKKAIASGNFLRQPCEDRHDMLCTAATDPYTVCGFRKVMCISAFEDFLVHHMSNRYAGKWGVSLAEFDYQVRTQMAIVEGHHPASALCEGETRLLHCEWSKSYYEQPVEAVLELVPAEARTILSVGCGWGAAEECLKQRGARVTAVPLDSVIGAAAARRGLEVVYGSLDECFESLRDRRFDCLVVTNLLHLFEDPQQIVARWASLVRNGGSFVISGPNFGSLRVKAKHVLRRSNYQRLSSFEASGVRMLGPRKLRTILKRLGVTRTEVRWLDPGEERGIEGRLGPLGSPHWALRATI